jgi:hypothetical protein
MAIIYSLKQIADIDHRKLGIINKFYQDVEGYIYVGRPNKTLFKFAKCSEVSLDGVTGLGDNVCDALNNLNGRVDILEGLHDGNNFVSWENEWLNKLYKKDDMVRDGSWTMIANKETDDRAAPQTIGDGLFLYPDNPAWVNLEFTGLVETGFRVSNLSDTFFITSCRVWIPDLSATAHYRVVTKNNVSNEIITRQVFTGDIFGNIGWHQIELDPVFTGPGDDITHVLQSQNFSSTTNINNPFIYIGSSNQENDPLSGNCERTNNQTGFRIHNTDRNGVDVTADNTAVTGGTIIRIEQDSDPLKFLEYDTIAETDFGTYFFYNVVLISSGPLGEPDTFSDVTVSYEIPVAAPTKYVVLPDFYLVTFSVIQGVFRFDEGPVIVSVDGNGIDVFIQQYVVSPDWDLVSVFGGTGGGFDSQIQVFTEGITVTTVDSGQVFVLNSTGTLFSNDAAQTIDSTRFGVQIGHGNYDVGGAFYDISGIFEACQIFIKVVYQPNNNGDMGIEIRAYSDKTNIPGSLVLTQSSGYKTAKGGNEIEATMAFHYPPNFFFVEAFQLFGVSAVNETITLDFFSVFVNKLKQ